MKRLAIFLGALSGSMMALSAQAKDATITLNVPGMYCEVCPATVSKALKKVRGVETVKASFEAREAVVRFDDTKTSVEALQKATANAGYPSTLKK